MPSRILLMYCKHYLIWYNLSLLNPLNKFMGVIFLIFTSTASPASKTIGYLYN
ncbi:hypothetical protein FDUTEX481_01618 [Tolypothrix sp. PCC 7601]|nr:hypothetical protein FDUTEX481_01618 [Tolypothrix sp. PCC 7601]